MRLREPNWHKRNPYAKRKALHFSGFPLFKLALLAAGMTLLLAYPVLAAPPPVPVSKKAALEQMKLDLEAHKGKAKDIETQAKSLKGDLTQNRKALVASSRAVQEHEKALLDLESEIAVYRTEYEALEGRLSKDKSSIAQFILAMERMDSVPMEALMIRPGGALETAQSAMVMEDVTEALARRAARLREDVARLEELSTALTVQKQALQTKLTKLEAERSQLRKHIAKKERLYANSQADLKAQQAAAKKISMQARSMNDLLDGLKKQRMKEAKQRSLREKASRTAGSFVRSFSGGAAQLPISGAIKVAYGEPDHLDAPSKGLWIEGRKLGLVVAPMDGDIRYTGAFKGYGNMIIIEHAGGYHSLVAGLESIDTAAGHSVSKGEPLGRLAKKSAYGKPRLYYELRHRGKVVDPSRKLSGR